MIVLVVVRMTQTIIPVCTHQNEKNGLKDADILGIFFWEPNSSFYNSTRLLFNHFERCNWEFRLFRLPRDLTAWRKEAKLGFKIPDQKQCSVLEAGFHLLD